MIRHLSLTNFKKHQQLDLTFTPGVNVICGPNYAGKSTVLHAIMFALWGLTAVPGGSAAAWRRGADGSTSVALEFDIGQKLVCITRTKTGATISENGEQVATGTSAVNARVEALLGLTRADFSLIKYAEQKETSALLGFGATNLNSIIERVSGVNLIDQMLTLVKDYRNRHVGALAALAPVDIEALSAEKEAQVRELQALTDLADLAADQDVDASKALEAATLALQEARERNLEADSAAERWHALETALAASAAALDIALERYGTMQAPSEGDLNAWQNQLTAMYSRQGEARTTVAEVSAAGKQLDTANQTLAEAEGRLKAATEAAADLQALREAAAQGAATQAELRETLAVAKERQRQMAEVLEASACPTCRRPYEVDFDRHAAAEALEGAKAALVRLRAESALADEAAAAGAKKLQVAEKAQTAVEALQAAELPRLRAIQRKAVEILAAAEKRQQEVGTPEPDSAFQQLERDLKTGREALTTLTNLAGQIDRRRAEVEALRRDLAALPEVPEKVDLTPLREAEAVAKTEALAVAEKRRGLAAKVGTAKQGLAALVSRLEEAAKANAKIAEAESAVACATQLQGFLKSNREKFLTQVWGRLLAVSSSICSDVTGGVIDALLRDSDTFTYAERGESMPLASASGAQQSLMGLALKVALAGSIPDSLHCLLLDEVTADMDEAHAQAVTALLGAMGHQIISVSHRDLDRSGEYNVIHLS